MTAYYNEHDPFAAQWLRNLIAAGHIAPGDVDERDIRDVTPLDLAKYRQCHLFAGIGVWSYALRMAGVRDDAEVWTCSCPCQPFSQAGAGAGFADERHLWPHSHWLISQRRPARVFGEQVASKGGLAWIDLVQADMEASGYAFGKADTCAAGFGAPHIRQRLYWVADATRKLLDGSGGGGTQRWSEHSDNSTVGELADARPQGRIKWRSESDRGSTVRDSSLGRTGPTNGFWRAADWLLCRDGKWRPVEPGTFPLAHGTSGRVGQLRAYGNAVVAEQAAEFIRVAMGL
jgi:DNA (cytosine-5)-methyltransferase 1